MLTLAGVKVSCWLCSWSTGLAMQCCVKVWLILLLVVQLLLKDTQGDGSWLEVHLSHSISALGKKCSQGFSSCRAGRRQMWEHPAQQHITEEEVGSIGARRGIPAGAEHRSPAHECVSQQGQYQRSWQWFTLFCVPVEMLSATEESQTCFLLFLPKLHLWF